MKSFIWFVTPFVIAAVVLFFGSVEDPYSLGGKCSTELSDK